MSNKIFSKLNRYLDTIFIVIIIILIICLIIALALLKPSYTISNFENEGPDLTNVKPAVTTADGKKLEMSKPEGCSSDGSLIGYCMDPANCCNGESAKMVGCYCNHPLVVQCKNEYEKCMNDTEILKIYNPVQRARKCKEQAKGCCIPFEDFKKDPSVFENPVKGEQKTDILCTLFPTKDIKSKCMELCQSNPNCAAYSVNDTLCNLFSKANMIVPISPLSGKKAPDTPTDYYKKK